MRWNILTWLGCLAIALAPGFLFILGQGLRHSLPMQKIGRVGRRLFFLWCLPVSSLSAYVLFGSLWVVTIGAVLSTVLTLALVPLAVWIISFRGAIIDE